MAQITGATGYFPKNQLIDLFQSGELITADTMTALINASYNPTITGTAGIQITRVVTAAGTTLTISGGGATG